jgi:uncharacterized RDD family membrane protein YckC
LTGPLLSGLWIPLDLPPPGFGGPPSSPGSWEPPSAPGPQPGPQQPPPANNWGPPGGQPQPQNPYAQPPQPPNPYAQPNWNPQQWGQQLGPQFGQQFNQTGSYCGWWRRVGAVLLDALILLIPELFLISVLKGVGLLLSLVLGVVYYGFLMSRQGSNNGQTLGKQATGYRVVRDNGQPVSFAFALLRNVLVIGVLGAIPLMGLLNLLWPLWDHTNQALHDKIVSTHVFRA